MTEQHHITPPPELRSQWFNETPRADIYDYIIEKAAQWGADQELEACCQALYDRYDRHPITSIAARDMRDWLREARRPKPPSLKQEALNELAGALAGGNISPDRAAKIRLALEQLDD